MTGVTRLFYASMFLNCFTDARLCESVDWWFIDGHVRLSLFCRPVRKWLVMFDFCGRADRSRVLSYRPARMDPRQTGSPYQKSLLSVHTYVHMSSSLYMLYGITLAFSPFKNEWSFETFARLRYKSCDTFAFPSGSTIVM